MNPQVYGKKFVQYAKREQQKLKKTERNEVVGDHIAGAVILTCGDMVNDVMRKKVKSDREFYNLLDKQEACWRTMIEVLNPHVRPFRLSRHAFRAYVYDAHPFLMEKWKAPQEPDSVQSEGSENCQP